MPGNVEHIQHTQKASENDLGGLFSWDSSQVQVIESILGLQLGSVLTVVWISGAGRSVLIAKIAYELVLRGERVLVTSYSDRVVDDATMKLPFDLTLRIGDPKKIPEALIQYTVGYKSKLRLGEKLSSLQRKIDEIHVMLETYLFYREKDIYKMKDLQEQQERLDKLLRKRDQLISGESVKVLKDAKIVASTLTCISTQRFNDEQFDTVLIEGSIQEPTLLALSRMFKARKWVLIGDNNRDFKTPEMPNMPQRTELVL